MFESALVNNDVGRVKLLARLGVAGVNNPRIGLYEERPLGVAVVRERLEMVKALIAAGADVNVNSAHPHGDTPLHSAARHGNLEIILVLLEAGANVNATAYSEATPCIWPPRVAICRQPQLFLRLERTLMPGQV